MEMLIRPASEDEYGEAMELVWKVFSRFNAPEYSEEGVKKFRQFLDDATLRKMFRTGDYRIFVFTAGDRIEGVISLRNNNHISLLFVDEKYQKKGIGSRLLRYLCSYCKDWEDQEFITVNSSPYAVEFYHKYGFRDTDTVKFSDGISYTPMRYLLD